MFVLYLGMRVLVNSAELFSRRWRYISVWLSWFCLHRLPRELTVQVRQHVYLILLKIPLQMLYAVRILQVNLTFLTVSVLRLLILRVSCFLLNTVCHLDITITSLLPIRCMLHLTFISHLRCRHCLRDLNLRRLIKAQELLPNWVNFDNILVNTLLSFNYNLSVDLAKFDFLPY